MELGVVMKYQNRYKLAIISSSNFINVPFGGMTNFVKDITPVLANYFDIHIFGIGKYPGIKGTWSLLNLKGKDIPFFCFSNLKEKKIIPNVYTVIYDLYKYKSELIKNNYDALYFHGLPLALPFLYGKNKFKIINHIHGFGNPLKYVKSKFYNNIIIIKLYSFYRDYVIRKSDLIFIAADIFLFDKIINNYKLDNIIRVDNFADSNIFKKYNKADIKQKLKLDRYNNIIVFVGRLVAEKGLDLLVDAFHLYNQQMSGSLLIIIGEGNYKYNLESKINNYELKDNIWLLGYKESNEIVWYLNSADLFAFPSEGEGLPVSLIEALCCGLPIVSTDVVGTRDMVINDVTGYRVKERDPLKFCEAITKALRKKEELSKNALELSKRYNPEKIGADIANYILKLLTEHKKSY